MTSNPYKIHVEEIGRLTGAWADHKVLGVYAGLALERSLPDNLNVQRWAAGVLGRLAALLHDDMTAQVTNCGCPQACRIKVDDILVTQATLSDTATPILMVHVQRDAAKEWTKLVKSKLAEIARTDQWQPTDADERRWTRRHDHHPSEHYSAPPIPVGTVFEAPAR